MFKKIFLMVLLLSVASICISDEIVYTESGRKVLLKDDGTWEYVKEDPNKPKKYHFRKTLWGMNRKSVMDSEKLKPIEIENQTDSGSDIERLLYEDSIIDIKCYIDYVFVNNKLALAGYIFTKKYSNENDYIKDFERVKGNLIKKYGKPKVDRVIWDDDLYKDNPSRYGFAVSIGHVKYIALWNLDETEIVLSLTGNNYNVRHDLVYSSTRLKEAYYKSKDKQNAKDF